MSTSATRPATAETAADAAELSRLRASLVEKDDLVALLTDRLEQAVERLDRLKREGVKAKPASESSAGQDLERLLSEWDAAAVPQATDRIEAQIAALQSVIEREFADLRATGLAAAEPSAESPSAATASSNWEAMKAALLDNDCEFVTTESGAHSAEPDGEPEPVLDEVEPLDVPDDPGLSEVAPVAAEDLPEPDPLPDGPAPIEAESCSRETLVEAVHVRDAYIIGLSQRALDRRVKLQAPTDWELIRGVPGELIKNVQRLHDELDEAVRMAEVQLCLERAKLSRERTELDQLRAELSEPVAETQPEETVKERRWRRMLGTGKS